MKIEVLHELKKMPHNWKQKIQQSRIKVNHDGTQAVVLVAKNGWVFDNREYPELDRQYVPWGGNDSEGKQVRLSMNSPLRMTWDEWQALVEQVELEYRALDRHPVV